MKIKIDVLLAKTTGEIYLVETRLFIGIPAAARGL